MQQTLLNGRYEIEHKIGEGGMATVYMGRDVRLNRRVAIKILHEHYAKDPDFLGRFQHEAQAAAVLSHPSVVSVYDVGQDGASHYIVMEHIEGENLKTLINGDAPLPVSQAVAIAEAVAYGLESAHRSGMIHRDIKPQNILVTSEGHVRITDFGIAKSDFSTALTQTGFTFGTADYISPEQARGQIATPQSDLYSLGITLYEMLTGTLPFSGDNAVGVAMQHVSEEPPPLREINPHVPPQLEALILQTLAKDPAQRPASAREFAQMLHQYRDQAHQQTALTARPIELSSRSAGAAGVGSAQAGGGAGRGALPQPRPVAAKAPPPNQGQGCVVFLVGLFVLVGTLALVLAYTTGNLTFLADSDDAPPSVAVADETPTPEMTPWALPDVTPGSEETPTTTATALPTPSPSMTPTPTTSPTATATPTPEPTVVVPEIRGMSESEARSMLIRLQLEPVSDENPRNDDVVPRGSVLDQEIEVGSRVQPGAPVTYTLSLGPALVEVPNLIQVDMNFARAEAERLNLRLQTTDEPSRSVSEGFVINQRPNPGSRIQPGDTIYLSVSIGDKVELPAVVGLLRDEAERLLEINNLQLEYVDPQGPDRLASYYQYRPNEVVSAMVVDGRGSGQPVDNGDYVPRNSRIVLGVRAP
jgi:serine/threonine-protein kinase